MLTDDLRKLARVDGGCLRFDFPQYEDDWWAVRRGCPTVSDMKKVLTPGGVLSAQAHGYICKLIGDRLDYNYGQREEYVSAAMKNGTIMEPEAKAWYQMHRNVVVESVGFCMTMDERFGCSPDGFVGAGVLESKSPTPQTQIDWLLADAAAKARGESGMLPAEHGPQCHGALIVTGRPWCDFLSYVPGLPYLLVRVTPNDYTDMLATALDGFWSNYQAAWDRIAALPLPPADPSAPAISEEDALLSMFASSR